MKVCVCVSSEIEPSQARRPSLTSAPSLLFCQLWRINTTTATITRYSYNWHQLDLEFVEVFFHTYMHFVLCTHRRCSRSCRSNIRCLIRTFTFSTALTFVCPSQPSDSPRFALRSSLWPPRPFPFMCTLRCARSSVFFLLYLLVWWLLCCHQICCRPRYSVAVTWPHRRPHPALILHANVQGNKQKESKTKVLFVQLIFCTLAQKDEHGQEKAKKSLFLQKSMESESHSHTQLSHWSQIIWRISWECF